MKIRPECATCEHWARDSFCTKISCGIPCVFGGELPNRSKAETIAAIVTANAEPPPRSITWLPEGVSPADFMAAAPPPKASDTQVGGDHYKTVAVQPWDVVDTWPLEQRIGYYRGGALKYVMRMGSKDESAQEIAKGKHYLEKLLEVLSTQSA